MAVPSPPIPDDRALVGMTIAGKYLVRSVIGEGGTAMVFDALHLPLGRPVALKVLRASHASSRAPVERFHREARAVGRIGHPNICCIRDLDHLGDGRPYLVMERLVGETLSRRIASSGGLPYEEVVAVLGQMLAGLVASHERGVIHRDIKPENVFIARRRVGAPLVKLLDFGAAKMLDPSGESDLTARGMVMGTPFYLSPEQARGERDLDERVDLYACGVVLYETLTGRRPFSAHSNGAILKEVLRGEPRPAREIRRGLPAGFDPLLRKAMARRRDERFSSAVEFQRALSELGEELRRGQGDAGVRRAPCEPTIPPPLPSPVRPPLPQPTLPHVDAHPTRVWVHERSPDPTEDAAPTRIMLRPLVSPGPVLRPLPQPR